MTGAVASGRLQSQEFDLNLAPIIDCFTVLIAFVMISSAFASIGILDTAVRAAGETAASPAPPAEHLTVNLGRDHSIWVRLRGQESHEVPFAPKVGGGWDYAGLTDELAAVKAKWPGIQVLTLVAENDVPYQDVIKSMEVSRKTYPAVKLGGF